MYSLSSESSAILIALLISKKGDHVTTMWLYLERPPGTVTVDALRHPDGEKGASGVHHASDLLIFLPVLCWTTRVSGAQQWVCCLLHFLAHTLCSPAFKMLKLTKHVVLLALHD